MYCSSCGTESIKGLQYCKRCGANLLPVEPSATSRPTGLVWIVTFGIAMMMGLPMGGIAIVYERLPGLLERGFPMGFLIALATISLLMVSLATVLLSRLLSPVFKTYLQSGEGAEAKKGKLVERAPAQLNAQPESVSSVTEGTTRMFEHQQAERDTR